jgi:hypothetical protein
MYVSKLEEGLIPPFTICPFENYCNLSRGRGCKHKGAKHDRAFSCGAARGFDLLAEYGRLDQLDARAKHGR